MKILIEYTPYSPFSLERVAGGVEAWTNSVISTLRESNHEITIFSCAGGQKDVDVFISDVPQKVRSSGERFKYSRWYAELDRLSRAHDKVLLTKELSASKLGYFPHLLSKTAYIEHYPHTLAAERGNNNHWFNLKLIQYHGGRTYAPNEWVIERGQYWSNYRWQERTFRPGLPSGAEEFRYLVEDAHTNLYSGLFDLPQYIPAKRPLSPTNPKKVMWIGRCQFGKRPTHGALALRKLSELGFECHFFTETITTQKTSLLPEVMRILEGSSVVFHLDAPHSEIFESYGDTNVLLWTTRHETVGLVGYEGALHGCRVVYDHDPCDYHLLPSGHVFKKPWKTADDLVRNTLDAMNEPFDRDECSNYFQTKYSQENCLKNLERAFTF